MKPSAGSVRPKGIPGNFFDAESPACPVRPDGKAAGWDGDKDFPCARSARRGFAGLGAYAFQHVQNETVPYPVFAGYGTVF